MILSADIRSRDLDHRDFGLRRLVADLVHHVRCLEAEQARHLDVDARFADTLLPHRLLDDLLAEGGARRSRLTIFSSASSAAPMVRMQ
jgi:hypothetical protein